MPKKWWKVERSNACSVFPRCSNETIEIIKDRGTDCSWEILAHLSERTNTNDVILESEELGHNETKPLNESCKFKNSNKFRCDGGL